MNAPYFDSRLLDNQESNDAVVTYTRVVPNRRPSRPAVDAPSKHRRADTIMDAGEIHPGEPIGFDLSAGEARGDRIGSIDKFVDDDRRPNWRRFWFAGASVAVVAGIGILAATFGVATILPESDGGRVASSTPALALNVPDDVQESAPVGAIREIPMTSTSDAPEMAPTRQTTAPIPRPRPEGEVAVASQAPTVPELAPTSAQAAGSQPQESQSAVASSMSSTAVPVLAAPQSGGTDGLINSIEETLARIDKNAAGPAPQALSTVPPQQSVPPTLAPPVAAMPPADVLPPQATGSIEPSYDILPPPAAVGGYDGYSTGPVPPAPVPDGYSQIPQLDPAIPGAYPSDPYALPHTTTEDTEARRPGFLRRSLAKATGAVERVFDRN